MNKVYSLDTFRALKGITPMKELIDSCRIVDQQSLDQHFKNIEECKIQNPILNFENEIILL
jgi:hypothetical protein